MKKTLLLLSMAFSCYGIAQVGINDPDPKATLDIEVAPNNVTGNTKEGLLIPRVTATRAKAMGTDVKNSTLVYIESGTAESGTTISKVDGPGYYYYDASVNKWRNIGEGPQGDRGIKGVRGEKGDDGPQGYNGGSYPGSTGPQGDPGPPALERVVEKYYRDDIYTTSNNYSSGDITLDVPYGTWLPSVGGVSVQRCMTPTGNCYNTVLANYSVFYNNGWKFNFREGVDGYTNSENRPYIFYTLRVYFIKAEN